MQVVTEARYRVWGLNPLYASLDHIGPLYPVLFRPNMLTFELPISVHTQTNTNTNTHIYTHINIRASHFCA